MEGGPHYFTPLTDADVLNMLHAAGQWAERQIVYFVCAAVFAFLWRAVGPGRGRNPGGTQRRERMSVEDQVKQSLAVSAALEKAKLADRSGVKGYDPKERWPIEWRQSERGAAPMADPGPLAWVVQDLIPGASPSEWRWRRLRWVRKGYITSLVGGPGTGKSLLAEDFALAYADPVLKGQWLGFDVAGEGSLLYVDTELDARTFWSRMFACGRNRYARLAADGVKLRRKWRPKKVHYLRLYASLASWQGQLEIRRAARKCKAKFIVIDSATIGAWGLSASDEAGWRKTYTALEQIGLPILLIDHLTKTGDKIYGSFIKEALLRSVLLAQSVGGPLVKVHHGKTNFGVAVEDFWFRKDFWKNEKQELCIGFTRTGRGPEPVEDLAEVVEDDSRMAMFRLPD